MNFKRVEYILIIAFSLLNIFLATIIYGRYSENGSPTTTTSVNIMEEMRRNRIELPPFENRTHYTLPYVQAEKHSLLEDNLDELSEQSGSLTENGTLYVSILSSPITLSNDTQLTEGDLSRINQALESENILFGEEYGFFDYRPEARQVVYTQTVNGIPIADGTSSITFYLDSQQNIISYEQTFAGPMTSQGEALELLTNQQAVEILFQNNYIPSNSKLHPPRLTYYRTLNLEELSMYVPVWYVKIETESDTIDLRVDAENGNVITTLPVIQEESEISNNNTEETNNENNDEKESNSP